MILNCIHGEVRNFKQGNDKVTFASRTILMTIWRRKRRDGEGRRRERGQVKNKRKPLKEQRRGEEAVVAGKEKRCR